MIAPNNVTACLVTRGDQPEQMARIRDSLIFDDVLIWDNSVREDRKTAGRYWALLEETQAVVYFQDDDVLVHPETQEALVAAYEPGVMVANWGHGQNPGGYDDLPLVGAGAIVDAVLPWLALDRYLEHWPLDDDFLYYCDFAAGALYESLRHLYLPFEINLSIAQHPSRLCNQPWAAQMKARVTDRARAIRASALVTA